MNKMKHKTKMMRAAMTLLLMMLTTATAWADVTAVYAVTCNTTTNKTTLIRNGGSGESVTWNFVVSGLDKYPWAKNASHGVDDEYDITFKPDKNLVNAGNIKTSGQTKFTVTVGAAGYYIKSVGIGGVTANAGQNAKTVDVTVPSGSTINVLSVTLIRYYTVLLPADCK